MCCTLLKFVVGFAVVLVATGLVIYAIRGQEFIDDLRHNRVPPRDVAIIFGVAIAGGVVSALVCSKTCLCCGATTCLCCALPV
ncbi:hypothetical protein B566_EDAN005622 [Ephemera danica]|nr:hypothetical protein B566_EDAN005622 [Ephemera danica]